IRGVEAAAFENQASACADGAFDLAFTPGLSGAQIFRADRQRRGRYRLYFLKSVSALLADVFVSRHSRSINSRRMGLGQAASDPSSRYPPIQLIDRGGATNSGSPI